MSRRKAWSTEDVLSLPVLIPLITAGEVCGRGRTAVYQDAAAGTFPTPLLRIGSRILVRRTDLLEFLGLSDPATASVVPATQDGTLRAVA